MGYYNKREDRNHVRPFSGITVSLTDKNVDGNFEKMLRKYKRKMIRERVLIDFKKTLEYKKDSEKEHYRDYVKHCKNKYGKRIRQKVEKSDLLE